MENITRIWNSLSFTKQERVKRAIAREDKACFAVCAETGQIFGNVKSMLWFHVAVARELNLLN